MNLRRFPCPLLPATGSSPPGNFLVNVLRLLLMLAAGCLALTATAADTSEEKAQTVIHMLDYVSVDYPEFVQDGKVTDEAEYQEQREFASQSIQLLEQLPPAEGKEALLAKSRELMERIDTKAPGPQVSALARAIAADVVRIYRLVIAPRQPPDVQRAASLFSAQCASCHGAAGRGDGPLAKGMDPAPSNFHDAARMDKRSIYGLFNTITLGVAGTPMRAFTELSEADRWGLAFLAAGLRTPPDKVREGERLWRQGVGKAELGSLRGVVGAVPADLSGPAAAQLDTVRSYLTANPSVIAASAAAPLILARAKLADSTTFYRAGDRAGARQAAITAYLEGFELVEAALDNVDPQLRRRTEEAMMALRSDIDGGMRAEAIDQRVKNLVVLLNAADEKLSGGELSPTAAFSSALLILLREGLEAVLVLAAIIAFVRKTGRRDALAYVHYGWIAAVALGAATWLAASRFLEFTGASREVTEGVAALLAAGMLLYVGLWLHNRSHAQAWQSFIREQVTEALGKRTLWAMSGVAFLAVYRELFEVILFYETLWAQAGEARRDSVLAGMGAGAVLLSVLAWAILKYSVRLPIGLFFSATSWLLVVMAVVFVGHGVAALQEAGWLVATHVDFIAVPLLGVHPNVQGLAAQGATLVLTIILLRAGRRSQSP